MGLLNNALPFSLIFAGQTQITLGVSSIINAITPLFTGVVFYHFLLGVSHHDWSDVVVTDL
jgi:drug/metabolite transporter (DMT)-like permease